MVGDDEIKQWLAGGFPTAEEVASLAVEMPWWLFPAVMRLRNCRDLSDEERVALAARLAAGAPDLEQMSMAANVNLEADFACFYPVEQPATPDTEGTIEKFLNTYGHSDAAEEELLNRLIFNPTPDYAQILAQEEEESLPQADEAPEGSNDALINSFILKSKAAGGQFPAAEEPEPETEPEPVKPRSAVQKPTPESDAMLSESLAQVYIKRGNFRKAFEIISHLNLNFPEKSIYFADQLRFLGKLIAIEERKSAYIDKNNNTQ